MKKDCLIVIFVDMTTINYFLSKLVKLAMTCLFAPPVILNAQRAQEKKLHFSDKVTHSVSLQCN